MSCQIKTSTRTRGALFVLVAFTLALAGCTGIRTPEERSAFGSRSEIAARIDLTNLPPLTVDAPLSNFLHYAMLNNQRVVAAYHDWSASVQRITVERSLPDPRLTFEADIARMVMSVMPGLMIDLPGPGKLRAAAAVASAESQVKYYQFEQTVLQTAFQFKQAYYQLYFLEGRIRINEQTFALLEDIETLARSQLEVGRGNLQDVLRTQIERDRLETEISNLKDSREPLMAQFKAALGMGVSVPSPAVPAHFEGATLNVHPQELFAVAQQRNPRLRAMEAEVAQADASLRLARRARVPDFSVGIEADVRANPIIWTPQAGVTLPIWRDKIAAQIAGAQANKNAAAARLSAEEIALAVEFAEKSFMLRESIRNQTLLRDRLLPKATNSLEAARQGYTAGKVEFINVLEAERTLLEFQLAEIEAATQRELALSELSLVIAGNAPPGAPILKTAPLAARETKSP